jgi:hypothetical protein
MTIGKTILLIGGIVIGLGLLVAVGVGLLVFLIEEIGNNGRESSGLSDEAIDQREALAESGEEGIGTDKGTTAAPSRNPLTFPLGAGLENEGNGFTGQVSGWLFGIACIPVVFCLGTRFIKCRVSAQSSLKRTLDQLACANKKYLMPFHTYLSILALALGVIHLMLSSCPNPFPEWGLILSGILVLTGAIIKYRVAAKVSPKFVKIIYQFHASLVVSGILASILFTGHILMD